MINELMKNISQGHEKNKVVDYPIFVTTSNADTQVMDDYLYLS